MGLLGVITADGPTFTRGVVFSCSGNFVVRAILWFDPEK